MAVIGSLGRTINGFRLPVTGGGVANVLLRTPPPIFFNGLWPEALTQDANGKVNGTTYASSKYRHTGTTYYVSPAGSDTTGNGTEALPWREGQKAHDTAAAGSQVIFKPGNFAPFTVSKNISFIAETPGTVYVGNFLASGDVTLSGFGSGRQTATLTSGFVYGFIDRTLAYPANIGARPHVSWKVADNTELAAKQAAGRAGVIWGSGGTASTIGTANGRDVTGEIGNTVLAWSSAAVNPLAITGTAQFYSSGIYYCGGPARTVASTARFVMEGGGCLGGTSTVPEGEVIFVSGTGIFKNCAFIGCGVDGDCLDYVSGSLGVCDGVVVGQSGTRSGDQAITYHGGKGLMSYGFTVFDCHEAVTDLGPAICCYFSMTIQHTFTCSNSIRATNDVEFHIGDVTYLPGVTPATAYLNLDTTGYMFVYDQSLDGRSTAGAGAATNLVKLYGTVAPTGDAVLFRLTVDPAFLFQDTAGTVPVTTSGQTVGRIVDALGSGAYFTTSSGTLTYTDTGGLKSLSPTNATVVLNRALTPFGVADMVVGLRPAVGETQFRAFGLSFTTLDWFAEAFTSGLAPTGSNFLLATTPTYRVDNGSGLTTKTALRDALVAGSAAHVLSVENIDLSLTFWNRLKLFKGSSTALDYEGDCFGFIIARKGSPAALTAYKATIATASGL